ncbi:MAG: hypothetical protein WBA93_33160 [Microcoleaceae cyanobacterium]
MSKLGFVSGHLEREQKLLRELNTASLALEAKALGLEADLEFSEEDILNSKKILYEFIVALESALAGNEISSDIQKLVQQIEKDEKPIEDWKEDLNSLSTQLKSSDLIESESLSIMDDILSFLDNEFVKDAQRLYSR